MIPQVLDTSVCCRPFPAMTADLTRRTLLRLGGATALALLGLDRRFAAEPPAAGLLPVGFGPLVADPAGVLDLPAGFRYVVVSRTGDAMADGLLVPLKDLTWHFVKTYVSDIYTASEQEIIDAMKLMWKHLRLVLEPSSAVPLAIILKNADAFRGKRVGIIITGGNVDLDKLPWN